MLLKSEKNMLAGDADVFRVYIRRNTEASAVDVNMFVDVNNKMRFKKFLKAGGKKLGIKASKCYVPSANGHNEIRFIDELRADVAVVLSEGEPFFGDMTTALGAREQETMLVSVLGAGGVGKSACALRFVRDFFVRDWDPTIEDAYRKTFAVDGKQCVIELLDTAGQDDFQSLRHQWMEGKDGYVFVYSVDSKESLKELDQFYDLHKSINSGLERNKVPIILVANKKDLTDLDPKKRQVPLLEGKRQAEKFGAIHIETSAASGEHVTEVFETLVREVRKRRAPSKEKGSKCCIL